MKILWLCNIALPVIAEKLSLPVSNKEGWLSGLSDTIVTNKEQNEIELGVCFPVAKAGNVISGTLNQIQYYGFCEKTAKEAEDTKTLERDMSEILEDFQPDIVHIFGTEFGHSLAMASVFAKPERTLVGIQGVCGLCAKHYTDGISPHVSNRFLVRDFLKQDNIRQQQNKFYLRGEREKKLLQKTGHITGRTDLDKAVSEQMNPKASYHKMNETLRSNFYNEEWKESDCEKYTIFMSQGDYPLKGLHNALQALTVLKKEFPTVCLRVAGNKITNNKTIKEKIKLSSYGKLILDLIKENDLKNHVEFLGMLDAEAMCQTIKKTHVFLNASSMENSPNSLGEAMLLGVPCVSSYVGGVPSVFTHETDGYCYQANEPDMLAYYIGKFFREEESLLRFSKAAREHAKITHNPQTNYNRLLAIYKEMISE